MSSQTLYTPQIRAVVLAHYERAAGFIAANFPLAPVEAIEYYPGPGGRAEYTASLRRVVPNSIPTVEIGKYRHTKRYIAVVPNSLLWLVHHNAIGFASWTPSPRDPESVGFGRIILSARNGQPRTSSSPPCSSSRAFCSTAASAASPCSAAVAAFAPKLVRGRGAALKRSNLEDA